MSADPDLLDRRQRVAAAILLTAVNLPANMDALGRLALAAADVCPGIDVGEIKFGQGLRTGLLSARALIDEMLTEMEGLKP